MSYEVGSRVFAIRNADETTVYAYGYGTYVGDHIPPGTVITDRHRQILERDIREADANPPDVHRHYAELVAAGRLTEEEAAARIEQALQRRAAEQARPMEERVEAALRFVFGNPKIVLDNGAGVVWGRECWWGPADHPRWESILAGKRVVTVPAPHPPEEECDGLCVDSADIGLPGYGVAYPHAGCPRHAPGRRCECGQPDRCASPTHRETETSPPPATPE